MGAQTQTHTHTHTQLFCCKAGAPSQPEPPNCVLLFAVQPFLRWGLLWIQPLDSSFSLPVAQNEVPPKHCLPSLSKHSDSTFATTTYSFQTWCLAVISSLMSTLHHFPLLMEQLKFNPSAISPTSNHEVHSKFCLPLHPFPLLKEFRSLLIMFYSSFATFHLWPCPCGSTSTRSQAQIMHILAISILSISTFWTPLRTC